MEKGSFKGFKKSEDDFYTVFNTLFAKLDEEEEMEEQVGKYHHKAPAFGHADSSR